MIDDHILNAFNDNLKTLRPNIYEVDGRGDEETTFKNIVDTLEHII